MKSCVPIFAAGCRLVAMSHKARPLGIPFRFSALGTRSNPARPTERFGKAAMAKQEDVDAAVRAADASFLA